ncbi:MAG: RNA polymerase sigma factor [Bacteroidota bacterium]
MTTTYEDIHRDVIELCIKGDPAAQFRLYSLYSGAMYNVCLRMVRRQEEAEDLLQEAFTYAFSKLGTFRFESAFGAWIKRITVNTCINHLKKKRAELVLTDKNLDRLEEDEVDYEDIEFKVEEVRKAIEQLPDGYRVVLSLYLLEGYDHQEIAGILNITESTSKSQYLRAKLKIKEILADHE